MLRIVLALSLLCTGCGSAEQPGWAKTVAAYEVPLPTASDKARFLDLVRKEAEARDFHVDAATSDDLKFNSGVSPVTFSAAVWRGEDDDEPIASAADFEDRIGRVWISFSLGQDQDRSRRFRESLVPKIQKAWPDTASLPIMPSGAIPLTEDLIRTPSGYSVKPVAAAKYEDENR